MRLSYSLFLASGIVLGQFASASNAEFVLDDFDDPAQVISPEMENVPVTTNDVGVLQATRSIELAVSGADPVGEFNSSVTSNSSLKAQLTTLNRTISSTPLLAFQFNYDFSPTDISEGGLNNAILFDFQSIEGNESPLFLRVIVQDDTNNTNSYQNHVFNLPLSSGPFTAVMPFDTFTVRGGSPGLPDFTTIDEMDFDFFFRPSDSIQWSAQLDRVRFGRIPEPGSAGLGLAGLLCLLRRQMLLVGLPFDIAPQSAKRDFQGLSNLLGNANTHLHLTSLDFAHVRTVDAGQGRKSLLRDAFGFAFSPYNLAKYFLDFLHNRLACLSADDYSTGDRMTVYRLHPAE